MTFLYYSLYPLIGPLVMFIFRKWKPEGYTKGSRRGVIFAMNHNSNAEGLIINAVERRPVRFLGKEELFRNPVSGLFLRGVGTIPIKRGASDNEALNKAIKLLKKGGKVGIFPEGTRGDGRSLLRPHTGVIRLALQANAPIIPVGISGGTKAWPKGRMIPRPFNKLKVVYGRPWKVPKPADGRDYSYNELKELSEHLLYDLISPLWDRSMEQPLKYN